MGAAQLLSQRNIRGQFFKRHEEVTKQLWVPRIAHEYDSDQDQEKYGFLGPIGPLAEWIGGRKKAEPNAFSIVIINKKFEKSVEISLDDLRRDKTGQAMQRIRDLALKSATLPQKLITDTIEAGGTSLAYDGIAFYGTHAGATGGSIVTNALTDTSVADAGVPTQAEMSSGILSIIQTILGVTDKHGEPMNEFANDFVVMIPTKYWQASKAALKNEFSAAGASETLRAIQQGDLNIELVHNPRLTVPATGGTGVFYGFRADSDVMPVIWQDEVTTDLDAKAEGSDYEYDHDAHEYGVKRICNAALAAFEMSARMTFS